MQPEQLQNTFCIRHHFLMLGGTFLGLDDLYQLDLVELVDADHASRAHPRCPGFAAKTRSVSTVVNRELTLGENFLAMNIGHRRFRGWDQNTACQSWRYPILPEPRNIDRRTSGIGLPLPGIAGRPSTVATPPCNRARSCAARA